MSQNGKYWPPRRHLRIEVALQIKFRSVEHIEKMIQASVLNLSRGGMFIRVDRTRKKGDKVVIEIPLSPARSVFINGAVRHVRFIDGHPEGIGIEFVDISDEALEVIGGIIDRGTPPPAND